MYNAECKMETHAKRWDGCRRRGFVPVIAAALSLLAVAGGAFAIGQSAVVTLAFPVGARPTAMGEAFTGLANDANAIYYNPAGLGQSPLTLSWKTHLGDSAFTAVAARSAASFGAREYVWAGSNSGLARFNGKIWETGEVYLPEENESIREIAMKYFSSDDKTLIDNAVWEILKKNNLGMKRYEQMALLLEARANLFKNDSAGFNPRAYARVFSLLPPDEHTPSHIAEILPRSISEKERKDLANGIISLLETEDKDLKQMTEISIPFSIAVRDTVTALALDGSERLWVATTSGLWRYGGGVWQLFTTGSKLPSNRITGISVSAEGEAAAATDKGLALLKNTETEWSVLTDENGLPDSYITAVAFAGNGRLFIGTPRGLARKSGNDVTVFDTSSGLLSQSVSALFADSKNQLWIGGFGGVTIMSGTRSWKRYKFPGSTVYSFAEQSNGTVWIGTNKGVVTHKAGKPAVDSDGKNVSVPEWKTYHSKNALKNDEVRAIAACGKDMWLATDAAVHQYAHAETQVLLFYEQLLPTFRMNDLWHGFPAIIIPTEDWGTLGFSVNFINMGDNERFDEYDKYIGRSRSWEGVFGVSYGLPVKENLSLGLNAKYVVSVLDASIDGWGQTFAIDAGVLKKNFLTENLDIGFMLQNMGPNIYYMTPEEADPIPFSLRLGLAYKPIRTPFHEMTLVFDAYREVVKNHIDKAPDPFWAALWTGMLNNDETTFKEEIQEINVSLGAEYMYADFMALRSGFLFDYLGERFELSIGLGIKYANMNFDFSYIYAPPEFMGGMLRGITGNKEKDGASGARDGQWRISFLFGL